MSVANCGCDENGHYTGGQAGDQTGKEWHIINWYRYNGGWECVLRHPDAKVGKLLAELATKAANNNNIGYDQSQRGTFYTQLKAVKWDPSAIKVKCEADCSAGTSALVIAVGYLLGMDKLKKISSANNTKSLKSALKNAGFTILTSEQYLTSDKYLLEGDILLKPGYHVCINVGSGSAAKTTTTTTTKKTSSSTKTIKKSKAFKVYKSASDAVSGKNASATYEAGTYTIKKSSNGAYLVTNSKHTSGGWIKA